MDIDGIVIKCVNGNWVARYTGPHAVEIKRLFGTDTLPTPFTSHTSKQAVLAVLRDKNPGVQMSGE